MVCFRTWGFLFLRCFRLGGLIFKAVICDVYSSGFFLRLGKGRWRCRGVGFFREEFGVRYGYIWV